MFKILIIVRASSIHYSACAVSVHTSVVSFETKELADAAAQLAGKGSQPGTVILANKLYQG